MLYPGCIGITGGIGSGKSRACSYLAALCGLPVIDLDQICRQLLDTGQPGWQALREALGRDFFISSGALDRKRLRQALFADEQLRSTVNSLVHPLARDEMSRRISRVGGMVLVEIPLLFEAGWNEDIERIVVVYADPTICCRRVVQRDHVSFQQARQAVSVQRCLLEKALQAHHVIDNSGCWTESCLQLRHLAACLV
jgi:dephospho-CoA kinase